MSKQPEITKNKKCINCDQFYDSDQERCTECDLPLTPIVNDLDQGVVIGEKYEIEKLIGDGGMGKIYKASHKLMKRTVAIKMLHSGLVGQSTTLARFKKEAEASSSLDHTNIVTTFDFGLTPDGRPYLVMDYLEGDSLAEILKSEKLLEPKRCLELFIQLCAGFEHAHSKGIIHRDIKPSNILVVKNEKNDEIVKILDFGIAKKVNSSEKESEGNGPKDLDLTEAGTVFGSPLYMSPEQVRGEELDFRSDIYSLSCLLYQALSGTPVYQADEPVDFMFMHVNKEPEPLASRCPTSKISDSLQKVVFKGLEKEPGERIQSMEAFKELLKKELEKMNQTSSSVSVQKVDAESDNTSSKTIETPITDKGENQDSKTSDQSTGQTPPAGISKLVPYLIPVLVALMLAALTNYTDTRVFDPDEKSVADANRKNDNKKNKKADEVSTPKNSKPSISNSKGKKLKRIEEERRFVSKDAKKLSPKDRLKKLLNEGKLAYDQKNFITAQNKFIAANSLAKKLDITSVEYLDSVYGLGKTLLERKKYQESLIYLNWALKKINKRYGDNSSYAMKVKSDIEKANQSINEQY